MGINVGREPDFWSRKVLITPLRDRWVVNLADGPDLEVKGSILDHEYTIEPGRTKVAEVSKKWFRVADTYGVEDGSRAGPGGEYRPSTRRSWTPWRTRSASAPEPVRYICGDGVPLSLCLRGRGCPGPPPARGRPGPPPARETSLAPPFPSFAQTFPQKMFCVSALQTYREETLQCRFHWFKLLYECDVMESRGWRG